MTLLYTIVTWLSILTPPYSFKGIVINEETKKPISNVNVSVRNSNIGTVTNDNGEFSLKINNIDGVIHFSYIGFESQHVDINEFSETPTPIIYLKPRIVQLNENLVITSSKDDIQSFENPDAISVVSTVDLKNNSPRALADALNGVTGVWMQQTNHGAGSPFVRGLTGNQTLLLVDGVRLNNATFRYGPNQYFNTLDVYSAKQLEVIRGKGSVLYGSDALGGVINVITRSPEYFSEKPRVLGRGKLKAMSHGMEYSGVGELELQSKNIGILASANYKKFGDIFAGGNLGYQRPSGYNEFGLNLKGKVRIGNNWQIFSSYQHLTQSDIDRYDQVSRNYSTYKFDPQIHDLLYTKIEHYNNNPLLKKVNLTALYQYSGEKRIIQKKESSLYIEEKDKVNTYGLIFNIHSDITQKWKSVSGLEFYADNVDSGKKETDITSKVSSVKRGLYPNNSSMKSFALYTQHTFDWNKIKLNIGGRFNTFDIKANDIEFGNVNLKPNSLVGNLSFQYFLSNKQQLILSTYSAFRTPNINDISSFGLFDNGVEVPSTNLKPENSYSFEIGYKAINDNFSMTVAAFNTLIKDQIIRVESSYKGEQYINNERVYTKQNIDRSGIFGIEFESSIRLTPHFLFNNNASWLYGKNLKTSEPMRRIPPLNGKLALKYMKSNFQTEIECLLAMKQNRLANGDKSDHRIPEGGTPGWSVVNLKAGYSWDKLSVNAGLNNLFNKAYRYHGSGVDGYGRSLWIALTFN